MKTRLVRLCALLVTLAVPAGLQAAPASPSALQDADASTKHIIIKRKKHFKKHTKKILVAPGHVRRYVPTRRRRVIRRRVILAIEDYFERRPALDRDREPVLATDALELLDSLAF